MGRATRYDEDFYAWTQEQAAALRRAADARLIASVDDIDWDWFGGVNTVGLTAGASAPEDLVQSVIDACKARFDVIMETVKTADETVTFKLPRVLAG